MPFTLYAISCLIMYQAILSCVCAAIFIILLIIIQIYWLTSGKATLVYINLSEYQDSIIFFSSFTLKTFLNLLLIQHINFLVYITVNVCLIYTLFFYINHVIHSVSGLKVVPLVAMTSQARM